jgi:hypothetical protein
MLRHPSRFCSVARLLVPILALGVALLGSTLVAAPAQAQPPPPITLPPIGIPPGQIPALPPIGLPPGQVPPPTGFNWGIHANGWQVCLRNRTDVAMRAVRSGLFDNISAMPDTVAPQSDNCTLRGQPSIWGGPANIHFAYQVTDYSFPLNVNLVSWYPRGTSPEFNFTCAYHASFQDVPRTCIVVHGTMQEPIFVILEYAE